MATRLRHKISSGVATSVVLIALSTSAWLAYASTAPNGTPSYPAGGVTTTTRPSTATTGGSPATTVGGTTQTTKKPPTTTQPTDSTVGGNDTTNTTDGTVATDPSDDDNLPFTGAQTGALALFGVACLAAGAALVYRRRQQRA
jgi:LPXTG-motif cell wall-anchored protein